MAGQTLAATLALREAIARGAFAAGTRLTEIALARRLGVSRTPLRAALAALAAEGLVERGAGGGYAVRGFGAEAIADAIRLRGVLEGAAARLAAERGMRAEELAALRGRLEAIDAALDPAAHAGNAAAEAAFGVYVAENAAFHGAIVVAAASRALAEAVAKVNALPFASASALVRAGPEPWAVLALAQGQHRAVLEAIGRREGSRAEALMREHARIGLATLGDAVREGG